ncbi:MAG: succinate dehydrogenase / fumarate reductase flavoprotein subunit [Planctomycetota bacterium]|jgi:succinate dehydrogenase / fumarate reductase flavoprotein subunit
MLDAKIPEGPLSEKWSLHKSRIRLINPANKRGLKVIVVGSGLSGAAAAASLAEAGYQVECFCFQDSPRRAHSIAAQGGINAAKNYQNDGDNVQRLFMDTLRGGDFRSREANVYRLAELSTNVIDQAVAQGVPFAREYGGLLANRSFGGVQVQRTFYARGQTGQQLLLGCYGALSRQIRAGHVRMHTRTEMLDVVIAEGRACGVITRDLVTGEIRRHNSHAVILASGGYGKIYYLSTLAMGCNASAIWRAHKRGALFANPSFGQIHPTCIPVMDKHQGKLTLMSESLRNDGRIWVPLEPGNLRPAADIGEEERDYYLERKYPAYGNLSPRDIASRAAKEVCDEGRGVGPTGRAVYLDFRDAIQRLGRTVIEERYGNLFQMYETITGINPYSEPMLIYPASHFSMGGLWVDYNLMTTVPGLFAVGECNFADHGANRLGANSLLQACVDGYFIAPYTVTDYLAEYVKTEPVSVEHSAFREAEAGVREGITELMGRRGSRSVDDFHRELGAVLWDRCGISRSAAGLTEGIERIALLREGFKSDLQLTGAADQLNPELEKAGRVADYLELGELMCRDALRREESCGAHFRSEFQRGGEAQRNDESFMHVSAWEYGGAEQAPIHHEEPLKFESAEPSVRDYR